MWNSLSKWWEMNMNFRQTWPCDDSEVMFALFRFSGALCSGGPAREGFSCNRPWTNWVIRILFIYSFIFLLYTSLSGNFKLCMMMHYAMTGTRYLRVRMLCRSTSLLWPAASTLPTVLLNSFLHFTLSAAGKNDKVTARRSISNVCLSS